MTNGRSDSLSPRSAARSVLHSSFIIHLFNTNRSSSSSSSSSSSLFAHKTPLKHARWDTREQDAQGTYCAPTEALNN